ncbi:hypothetical protein L6164_018295 [Bauhinia variegata]|uniref:Uncharacterized protein n=1 Tax=Bauhinia variegata TaxID=167791 RepID=A0ACB9NAK8_BAUVA|nr:hypothetical protein L6164_018295 [Bauhinia variegata]
MNSFGFLLLLAFLAFCSNFASAANCTLDSNEEKALEDIARTLGKNDNYTISSYDNSTTPGDSKYSESTVWCNCSFAGNTSCHITHIWLKSQNLTGVLPTELTKLSYLQEIDLTRNYLNGTIPAEWGSLNNLQSISLGVNRLNGSIPKELGNIATLTSLVLEFNDFSGNLPPELGNLTRIERLHLTSNNFTGELPPEFAKLTALKEFRIGGNQFSGKIPDYIRNWTLLEKLVMVGSGFSGPIPSSIFLSLKNLSDLQISDLSGPDSTFPQLNETTNLSILTLRNCNINGTLPAYLENMTPFDILDLSFNKLSGQIPNNSTNLSKAKHIYLTGNYLTGLLPEWTENTNHPIDLSYNSLTIGEPTECTKSEKRNLFASSSTGNNSNPYFCASGCSTTTTSLHINSGGQILPNFSVDGSIKTYDADTEGGAAYFKLEKNWAISNTGDYVDASGFLPSQNHFIVSDAYNMMNDILYKTARASPISLTYYGYCLGDGTYTVSLHFAEIMFTNDKTYSSLGRRVFNIYIQGKLERENFDIAKAAGGVGKVTIQNFTAVVNSSGTLEIRFYWAGKGTTAIPFKSVYGPLISAISVHGDFPRQGSSMSAGAVVGIVAAGVIIIILVFVLLWLRGCLGPKSSLARGLELQTSLFSLRQIKAATNNFDITNKIGEGGFGSVYKGFLPDGTIIAVKLLSSKSKQGNREFITEIGMISGLQHPYLVKLYGCCVDGDQLLLVYEYMENNSLARALFGQEESRIKLDWPTSTRIAGTYGYMAPEYAMHGYLTNKADVYSFGVVTLEIVSGKNNTVRRAMEESFLLLEWAHILKEKDNLMELVDPRLGSDFNKEEAMVMIKVGILCTNVTAARRPTMSSVVSMLEGRILVPELVSESSEVFDEMKLEAMRQYYRNIEENEIIETTTQSASKDGPWTASSSSAADLYPVHLDSSYWDKRN